MAYLYTKITLYHQESKTLQGVIILSHHSPDTQAKCFQILIHLTQNKILLAFSLIMMLDGVKMLVLGIDGWVKS